MGVSRFEPRAAWLKARTLTSEQKEILTTTGFVEKNRGLFESAADNDESSVKFFGQTDSPSRADEQQSLKIAVQRPEHQLLGQQHVLGRSDERLGQLVDGGLHLLRDDLIGDLKPNTRAW